MKKKKKFYFILFFLPLILIFGAIAAFYYFKYPIKYKDEIIAYSVENNLDPRFVASLINVESSFKKDSVSTSGAIGLMQILPSTGKYVAEMFNEEFNKDNLFDPKINIKYGCKYLRYLKDKFDDDDNLVLLAYNAGEGTVKTWLSNKNGNLKNLNSVPYKVTEKYAKDVLEGKKYYSKRI